MILEVSADLKKLDVYANGMELAAIMGKDRKNGKRMLSYPDSEKVFVHRFNNPVLMTDNYQTSKLKPGLRDTLFSLYSWKPRIVGYNGVSVFWDYSHKSVWCPSIDTVLFAKALNKILKDRKNNFKTGAEIGCGSGFLSKYLLAKNKTIKSFLVNDINPYAIKCAMDNITDHRAVYYTGNGIEKLKGHKFDVLLCNPPYVPRPKSIDDNPYEGISLLYDLVHNGQKYLNPNGVIVTNISSLCWNLVMNKKPKMKMQILEKMRVPLKVNNIMNNPSWLRYLQSNGLKKKFEKGYEYWQTLYIVALRNVN